MTVQVQDTVFRYTANGVTTSFAYSCLVLAEADLVVTVDGAIVTSGFTISGIGSQTGGNVVFTTAPANLASVIVQRLVALERQTDYQQHGDWLATVVNKEFDRLWMAEQQQKEQIDRSIKFPVADGALTTELPPAATRAGKLQGFDALGNVIAVVPIEQTATALQALLALFSGSSLVGWIQSGVGAVLRLVQDKLRDTVSVRDFISTTIDGTTSNQTGIAAAVAAAYAAGARLYWPVGTYVSTATIPNLHDVEHFGKGIIKRGTDTFAVNPQGKSTQTNTLYVATTGAAANDGLTSSEPMADLQQAFDALTNAGQSLAGTWQIQLAAGTWNDYAELSSIKFKNRLNILGASVSGGVPTTIIDGTGMSAISLNGMYLFNGIYAYVKDIKFTNWNGGSGVGSGDASSGLNVSNLCNVWADNVHADACGTGVSATRSRLYQGGGIVQNCDNGSMAFGCSQGTFGYVTATTYLNNAMGIIYRDTSNGTIENGVFTTNTIGVKLMHQSVARISNSTFTGSVTSDVYLYTGSSCFFGTGNTYTAGKKIKAQFALSLDACEQFYYDGDVDRFNFGAFSTPSVKFHFRKVLAGSSYSSSTQFVFEDTSPQVGLAGGSGSTSVFGLNCSIPANSSLAAWQYVASDNTWRMRLNSADAYRFASTSFTPRTDNTVTLGAASFRWSTVYAGTGTIDTSDEREKQQIKPIDAAALRAWAKVNYCQFKFNDAVAAKGDGARWHLGVIAQRVKAAFESEGLDPFAYGLLCYDEWDEQIEEKDAEGNVTQASRAAGNRFGIRYEEALALECAYLRSRLG